MENTEKTKWEYVFIYTANIIAKGESNSLVIMPKKSDYADYKFWYPTKLIREVKDSKCATLSLIPDHKFKLFKQKKGEDGKYVTVDEVELTDKEMKNQFMGMSLYIRKSIKENSVLEEAE